MILLFKSYLIFYFIDSYVIFVGFICKFDVKIALGIKFSTCINKTLINIRAKVYLNPLIRLKVIYHLLILSYYSKNIAKYGY